MSITRRRVLAAGALLAASQVATEAREPVAEPPGMVDIGDRRLAMIRAGTGTPAVILESGLTAGAVSWYKVQPLVAEFTAVYAYDRANLPRSDPAPKPRTAGDAAADFQALLSAAAIPGPYVLVGASFGGFIVRLFAAARPDDVAGLVLIDASHEDQADRLAEVLTPEQQALIALDAPRNIEGMDLPATWDQVRAAGPLPDVPLVVLSAANDKPVPPGFPQTDLNRIWRDLQDDLTALTPNSLHLTLPTGHDIALERPRAVADAIRLVVDAVRAEQPLATPPASDAPATPSL